MTPQELKNSILQLAIQGKLVEQRPEEGTGEDLYRQIQAEKQKLIKEGKIKKDKPLPEITDDEKPFDIPESWKLVRFSDLFDIGSAMRIHQSDWKSEGIPFFRGRELVRLSKTGNPDAEIFISQELYEEKKRVGGVPQKDDLLVTAVGTLGKVYIVKGTAPFYYKDAYILRYNNYGKLYSPFFKLIIESPPIQEYIADGSMGTTVAQLTIQKAKKMICPLPPLAEQKRIVAKIEELLPLIDRYEQAWSKLEDFNKRFPTDMQKSILQMAIEGKLVEQRPEEGTGEDFFAEIQKRRCILEKKKIVKRQSTLPIDEETPYEIPNSWKWIRIGDIEEINLGFTYRPQYVNDGIYFLSVKDISNGKIDFSNAKKVSKQTYSEASYGSKPQKGDILFGRVGTMGKPQIIDTDIPFCIFVSLGFFRDHLNIINKEFVSYWMQTSLFDKQVEENVKGSAQKNLNTGWLKDFYFPLPPLAEQKRIVEKLNQLLPLCERLK